RRGATPDFKALCNCLARPDPVFQGEIEGSPLHMPKIGPWWRKKPLISWEKLGVDALNNYGRQSVQRVLPRAGVVQTSRRRAGQSEGVVEFPIGEESGVTGDGRAVKRQLDLAVEVNAQGVLGTVTHWVPRSFRQEVVGNAGFSGEKAQTPCRNDRVIWEIRDQQTASHDSSS